MRRYPKPQPSPVTDRYFDTEIVDPYRNLENPADPATRALVEAENAYTHGFFAGQNLVDMDALEASLRGREKKCRLSGVREALGVKCAMRELDGGIHDLVRLNDGMGVEKVILNEAMLGDRMHIFTATPCPTARNIYAVMGVIHGHPRCCVVIWDDAAGKELAELDGTFGFAWSKDGESILWSDSVLDAANNRNINTVHRYFWRSGRSADLYTHEENSVFINVAEGPGGGAILQVMNTYVDVLALWCAPDGKIIRLNDGAGSWKWLGCADGRCFFQTSVGAPMGRVVSISETQLLEEDALLNAADVIIPEGDALLASAGVVGNRLLAVHERDACSEASVYGLRGEFLHDIELPERFGHIDVGMDAIEVTDEGRVYLNFESFTRQNSIYALDAGEKELRFVCGDDGDYSDIAVDQHFLRARDGQRILVYIVRLADQRPDGRTPVLMYGYGGYACSLPPVSEDPVVGVNIAEWVRRGRIYAHAIIRGGLEYGAAWHEAAMFDRKKNAFYDFIDIAEELVRCGWTCPGQIVATGLSNGGLLMTAVTTLRPDLFGVVIASVPHTDMLRFRNDDRGMMYVTEYGDPLSSREMFEYMRSYSPYHNIRAGVVYPWIYVQTGEMDNNVPPYHGKKFAVRLQQEADERHPVLLQVLSRGSHDRGVGDEMYMNLTQMQAFIELGLAAQKKD